MVYAGHMAVGHLPVTVVDAKVVRVPFGFDEPANSDALFRRAKAVCPQPQAGVVLAVASARLILQIIMLHGNFRSFLR